MARQNTGPLRGLRVIEIAGIGPGPFCGMLLADLGADVIRVERPGGGIAAVEPKLDLLNRGKRSVGVDLKDPADVEKVLQLVEQADVLFEGFRPGVAERLGIGPEVCLARRPQLVYGRMTGWGQEGPRAQTSGHDINYLAITGALHATGHAGGPPEFPMNLLGDFGGGAMYLVTGILAALYEARSSGQGQVVDASIVDGVSHLMAMTWSMFAAGGWRDERGTNLLDSGAPFYDVYPTSDGRHMAVGPLEPRFFAELARGLGLPEAPFNYLDREAWPRLRSQIASAFLSGTQQHWTEVFEGTDACVAPVLSLAQAADDPHLAARSTYLRHDGVVQPAPAPRFSRTPASIDGPPSIPGEHSPEALLTEWTTPPSAPSPLP